MRRRDFGFCFIWSLILIGFGCNDIPFWPKDEGVITYKVSYPHDQENSLVNIMPTEMKLYFKGNQMKLELSSFGGIMKTQLIANSSTESFVQVVSIFGESMLLEVGKDQLTEFLSELTPVGTKVTAVKDSIAGLSCVKGNMFYTNTSLPATNFYFTEEIGIDNPNFFNQFNSIDGVLLDYEIEQMGMKVRLIATEAVPMKLPKDTFEIEGLESMPKVTYEELSMKMGEMMAVGR